MLTTAKRLAANATVRLAVLVILLALLAWVLFPLLWMLSCSFKTAEELYEVPPDLLPRNLANTENYRLLLTTTRFGRYYLNTLMVAFGASFASMILAAPAAYAATRFRFWLYRLFPAVGLVAYMLPRILLVISLHGMFRSLGMLDSLFSVGVLQVTFSLPYALWLLRSYFASIPLELEEAAWVDGASRAQGLRKIVMPLATPGVIATFVFLFIVAWNDYLYSLVLISSDTKKTLTLGVVTGLMTRTAVLSWGMLMAAGVLMTLPIVAMFMVIQRHLVAGFTAGSVKG
ncbi:carbohydrate ABC transporter permease [Geochorda subterranea]|uniref:Carbohydrate ABC transporter permease n=1 Tax=Geochorda subterranea TaxID=3109564 RepID=A0ABZ1BPB8_9FIRM|nr:carbohydrate ABC transporter permease [Limnochorda sp. LNt]WRP14519.1 carbohydrate ABC transporter permease [Limnochorda sp. LNt]